MNPIGPGNHERAWNDPPKFAFNSGSSGSGNPSGRRRLLNKRVPVPIGPQTNSPVPTPLRPGDGPPIGTPPKGPPPTKPPTDLQLCNKTTSPKPELLQSSETMSSQDKLQQVETAFRNSLRKVSEHLKDNVHEEIMKRFDVMKTMWSDDKLNDSVQNRLVTLLKALEEENFDEAWSLHQGLIVDFTSMCSPWMVGIKTLIIESRSCRKREPGEEEEDEGKEHEDLSERPMLSPVDINKISIRNEEEESDSKPPLDEVK